MNSKRIPVMEIFGPTIQGEGMVIGQKTMFVRTAGCDYSCDWCDSSFTWDGSGKDQVKQMTSEEIWQELKKLGGEGFSFVTISGGNPALLKDLSELIKLLKTKGINIGLETQGSIWQEWFFLCEKITLSPKPLSSRMTTEFSTLDTIVEKLKTAEPSHETSIKIVIFTEEDYQFAKMVHLRYPEIPFFLQVGNDDSKNTNQEQLVAKLLTKYEWLIDKVIQDAELKNVRVLPQLHTLIWGNRRGV